jgi:hypothetical protein
MGAAASLALLAPPGLSLTVAGVCLATGVTIGTAVAVAAAAWGAGAADAACDALDAVDRAAEAMVEYLRAAKDATARAASEALEKLEIAAAFVRDRVVRLLRCLCGRRRAAAARREMGGRAARRTAGPDAFAKAAARVARSRRRIVGGAAASSSVAAVVVVVPHDATGPAGVLARLASRSAAEMMDLILETFVADADLGDSIPAAARSSITVIVAATAVSLDAVSPIPAATKAQV